MLTCIESFSGNHFNWQKGRDGFQGLGSGEMDTYDIKSETDLEK